MKKLSYVLIMLVLLVTAALLVVSCAKKAEPKETIETIPTEKVELEAPEEETDDGRRSDHVDVSDSRDDADNSVSDVPDHTDEETTEVLTAEELAEEILNKGINGPEREAFLGDRYEEVQRWIDANYVVPEVPTSSYVYEDVEVYAQPDTGYYYSDGALTPDAGINYYGGVLETYYNLDMSWNVDVMRGMGFDEADYPYWIRGDGCKMLGDYVMVAADFGWEPRGTITSTSLGPAIVVDTGAGGWYWHDICVTW